MAIVQISKIIHRTGANVDLPQLDIGEIGFATDEQRVYIGNDPAIVPPIGFNTTQTEILTSSSTLDFSRIQGSDNTSINLTSIENGQLLGVNVASNIATIINVGGNAGGEINLGTVSNVKLNGGINGYILQTDGSGNLAWTTNGVLTAGIANVSKANPAVVTTQNNHLFGTGVLITIGNVGGMTELTTAGVSSTNSFYTKRESNTTFSLYTDSSLSTAVNSNAFTAATANTGYALGTISPTGNAVPGGASRELQFNDSGGAFGGDSRLTFDISGNLWANTIVNATTVYAGNVYGPIQGIIGATTPNTATFTSVTVNNNLIATGNITADIVLSTNNGAGENFKVGDDIWIGDINLSDTMQLKGVADSANAYIVFGDGDTTKLGRSGTGPLTYAGDFEATGNVLAVDIEATSNITAGNLILSTWSMFANIDGLYATDGSNTYSINLTQL